MVWGRYLLILTLFIVPIYGNRWNTIKKNQIKHQECTIKLKEIPYRFITYAATIAEEAIRLNLNLLSLDTVKVITAFIPFYLATRMADTTIHNNFYDAACHKNINQMHSGFIQAINKGCDIGIVSLSSLALLAWDDRLRTTARIFGIGALSALYAKDFVKKIRVKPCLRPWNEHFSAQKQSYGGFPSGHMIESTYMLTVWGLQYGLKAAIPLGIFTGLSFGVLVGSNRHYASQAVAGAGFGVAFGLAANHLINSKLGERLQCQLNMSHSNKTMFGIGYTF